MSACDTSHDREWYGRRLRERSLAAHTSLFLGVIAHPLMCFPILLLAFLRAIACHATPAAFFEGEITQTFFLLRATWVAASMQLHCLALFY